MSCPNPFQENKVSSWIAPPKMKAMFMAMMVAMGSMAFGIACFSKIYLVLNPFALAVCI